MSNGTPEPLPAPEPARMPIARKVKYATAGTAGGFGIGIGISQALVAFGVITPEQGNALNPLFNGLGAVLGAFLGGYVVREAQEDAEDADPRT